jgi:hypothetical protein
LWVFLTGGTVCSHMHTLVPRSRIFLPWKWRRHVPLKRRFTQHLHGTTSQKTAFFTVTAVKTSDLTKWMLLKHGGILVSIILRNQTRAAKGISENKPGDRRKLEWSRLRCPEDEQNDLRELNMKRWSQKGKQCCDGGEVTWRPVKTRSKQLLWNEEIVLAQFQKTDSLWYCTAMAVLVRITD